MLYIHACVVHMCKYISVLCICIIMCTLFCGLRLCYTVSHILITVMCMQLLHVLHVQLLSLAHNVMYCMDMYTYVLL